MPRYAKFERELVFRSAGFPLDVSIWENHPDYPVITHDFCEIAIVLHGTAFKEVAGQIYPLKAGDVFALQRGTPHGYRNTDHLTVVNITYDPVVLEHLQFDVARLPGYRDLFFANAASAPYRVMHLDMEQLQQVHKLARAIEKELHPGHARRRAVSFRDRRSTAVSRDDPPPADRACQFMAMARFMLLVGLLSRWRYHKPKLVAEKLIGIRRAIDHLDRHFDEALDLADIARRAGMSYRNFHRLFQQVTDQPPAAYLRRLRLAKAAQLLQTTDRSITDIALECGFADGSHFARGFRQQFGLSPRRFRTPPGG